jgi:acyl carrier protein
MELNTFLSNFEGLFDELKIGEIKENTVFRDLDEWNSLMALSVIAMVDEEYDKKLTAEKFKSSTTVGDLFLELSNG